VRSRVGALVFAVGVASIDREAAPGGARFVRIQTEDEQLRRSPTVCTAEAAGDRLAAGTTHPCLGGENAECSV